MENPSIQKIVRQVPWEMSGMRLDHVLAQLYQDFSRTCLQRWLDAGHIRVDHLALLNRKTRVRGGEQVELCPPQEKRNEDWQAEPIPLAIVYEDDQLLVVNKPVGLVVHPAAGHASGTLVNALLHRVPQLEKLPRAGLVHRLDRDTSGLLVVAKTLVAHKSLVEQLQQRTMGRSYEAVVCGVMTAGGCVDAPVGRHPVDRKRMAIVQNGRKAVTHYRVIQRFSAHTHIRLKLETGRTHQIRVHLQHIGYPLVGDPVYGQRLRLPKGSSVALRTCLSGFRHQALHAVQLELTHPETHEQMSWHSDLPEDMQQLLEQLGAA
ncbi:MAG: 23S rRNA pseudouridine(1911/1915/1917) synthase RluD [Gammaproteobacteria bacterium]|nr:MAG: 23S rRNA pseudouridine(1911/1915/1917) synthase RluD [Gammaproteobacteria bacterium]